MITQEDQALRTDILFVSMPAPTRCYPRSGFLFAAPLDRKRGTASFLFFKLITYDRQKVICSLVPLSLEN